MSDEPKLRKYRIFFSGRQTITDFAEVEESGGGWTEHDLDRDDCEVVAVRQLDENDNVIPESDDDDYKDS